MTAWVGMEQLLDLYTEGHDLTGFRVVDVQQLLLDHAERHAIRGREHEMRDMIKYIS